MSTARATACCKSASRRTSTATAMPPTSVATAAAASASTSATTTPRAPSAAKRRHNARPMPFAPPVTTATLSFSCIHPRNRFRHAGRLVFAFDLDRHLPARLPSARNLAQLDELHAAANPRAHRHWVREPHLVRPVIDPHAKFLPDAEALLVQIRNQRQRQEPVRDRGSEG